MFDLLSQAQRLHTYRVGMLLLLVLPSTVNVIVNLLIRANVIQFCDYK